MESNRLARRTGWACLLVGGLMLAPSVLLHCVPLALRILLRMGILGSVVGLALGGVTRTRRATSIYLGLLTAFFGGYLFLSMLDNAATKSLLLPQGTPRFLEGYPTLLRVGLFFVSIPYPFARFGTHTPDILLENSEVSGETE